MINLHEEAMYLKGARDILLRLQDDYAMYIIPAVKCRCKPSGILPNRDVEYAYFPIPNSGLRKLLGKAVIDTLLYDRESLVNFLQGQTGGIVITETTKNKQNKITSLKVKFEK